MIQKINFHHLLIFFTPLYGAILHNALKKIKFAFPIGMLLRDTRVFSNIRGRTTPPLSWSNLKSSPSRPEFCEIYMKVFMFMKPSCPHWIEVYKILLTQYKHTPIFCKQIRNDQCWNIKPWQILFVFFLKIIQNFDYILHVCLL